MENYTDFSIDIEAAPDDALTENEANELRTAIYRLTNHGIIVVRTGH